MKTLLTTMILMIASLSWAQDGIIIADYQEGTDSVLVTVETVLDINVAEFELQVEGELVLDSIVCSTLSEYGYDPS